ncbi:MAG: hypothetical protein SFV21_11110 [Rhodospirillaceae bacterium]|nr:hypothetical protein [Rhodospirillaceae bacterium]
MKSVVWMVLLAASPVLADDRAGNLGRTTDDFCVTVQQLLEGTAMVSQNEVHPTYDSFKASKAEAKPLLTEQYVLYADEAARSEPLRISCKAKTGDLLNELYGPGASSGRIACQAIHQRIAADVFAGLTDDERAAVKIAATDIVYEADETVVMGSKWVAPFDYAWMNGGKLHLKSKALLAEWDNILFKLAPPQFRGTHYCHLIAPEHLKRLVLGLASPPAPQVE